MADEAEARVSGAFCSTVRNATWMGPGWHACRAATAKTWCGRGDGQLRSYLAHYDSGGTVGGAPTVARRSMARCTAVGSRAERSSRRRACLQRAVSLHDRGAEAILQGSCGAMGPCQVDDGTWTKGSPG